MATPQGLAPIGPAFSSILRERKTDRRQRDPPPALCVNPQDKEYFKRIPEPKEDELDMLDMAFGLTDL